ncbi:MAG: response regulator [Bacteroidetes bacterium]|nr:response regulator [Bacteroidota bacterium]MBS1628843.1 response regulator [Bacteroidota bacterium]
MKHAIILIAEDDADDQFLLKSAIQENGFTEPYFIVENGSDLIDYLQSLPQGAQAEKAFPKVILMDLNMPRKDGRETLKEIKQHAAWKHIPVVVFSTTHNEMEMRRCYELGAHSYQAKPNNYEQLLKIVAGLKSYWKQKQKA